jgi:hypothetical protein
MPADGADGEVKLVVDRTERGNPLPQGACLLCQVFARLNRDSRNGDNGQCVAESIKDVVKAGNGRAGRLAPGLRGRFGGVRLAGTCKIWMACRTP